MTVTFLQRRLGGRLRRRAPLARRVSERVDALAAVADAAAWAEEVPHQGVHVLDKCYDMVPIRILIPIYHLFCTMARAIPKQIHEVGARRE